MPRHLVVVTLVLLTPGLVAAAKGGDDMGDRGVFVPFGNVALTNARTDSSSTASSQSSTTVTFAPGLLAFVIDGLAVGGNVLLASSKVSGDTRARTTFGVGPEVAYHVRFNELWSLFPSASLDLTRDSVPGGGGNTTDYTTLALSLYVPVLLRVSHFYMGFGPFFSRDLYSHASVNGTGYDVAANTSVGLSTTLSGWL